MNGRKAIFVEKKTLKPRQKKALAEAGYLVLEVADITKIKIAEPVSIEPVSDENKDDGFRLP